MRTGLGFASALGITLAWGAAAVAWPGLLIVFTMALGAPRVDYAGHTRQFMEALNPIALSVFAVGWPASVILAIVGAWARAIGAAMGWRRWLGLAMFNLSILPLMPLWLATMPWVASIFTPQRPY